MLSELKNIHIADYDYPLPDERIARYPAEQRDGSRLLCLHGEAVEEHRFGELPSLLPEGSMLVFNNTKVIHARLFFRKATGAVIEVFCLEPYGMAVSEAFEQRSECVWTCYVGNNKKWKGGALQLEAVVAGQNIELRAERREAAGDAWIIGFSWTGGASFAEVIEAAGVIPLPPYLHREATEGDAERYQTVYAQHEGSVAAPTAGLHFTPQVLHELAERGMQTEYITLHVGAGTFKPVTTSTIGEHEMHVEPVRATADNLRRLIEHRGGPLVAVGTTTVRTLESLYWFGVQLERDADVQAMHVHQWEPYERATDMPYTAAYANILRWMERHDADALSGATQLMIAPGYRYRVVQGLVTNFHQPKSTLLLLVSALVGERWREAYSYALDHNFRFLSYGDSCLFLP